jgi:hypothetical protein
VQGGTLCQNGKWRALRRRRHRHDALPGVLQGRRVPRLALAPNQHVPTGALRMLAFCPLGLFGQDATCSRARRTGSSFSRGPLDLSTLVGQRGRAKKSPRRKELVCPSELGQSSPLLSVTGAPARRASRPAEPMARISISRCQTAQTTSHMA